MPETGMDVEQARRGIAAGDVVVVPPPSPLTYVVAAATPTAVNAVKGRPPGQEVAVWVTGEPAWRELSPSLDLDAADAGVALRLLREELVTLLVPVRGAVPSWTRPAVRDGYALLFGVRWAPLRALLDDRPYLYASSGNTAGRPPAATAAEARAMFGPDVPVVDGDAWRDPRARHAATTMLRIDRGARISLVRHGVHDAAHGGDTGRYLAHVAGRYVPPVSAPA